MPRYTEALSLSSGKFVRNADQDQRYVGGGRLYIPRWKEWKVPARVREGEKTRERWLNTDSTIPGRLAFHRQSGPSTTDRKVRVFPPSRLHAAPLIPSSPSRRYYARSSSADCWSRLYRFPSFATAWLAILVFFYASSNDLLLLSGILSPSSSRRTPAVDIASIESDVEGALSGSSRRPEYPAAASSTPPLLLHFLGKLPRWHRWEGVCRTSISNKVTSPRDFPPSRSIRNL